MVLLQQGLKTLHGFMTDDAGQADIHEEVFDQSQPVRVHGAHVEYLEQGEPADIPEAKRILAQRHRETGGGDKDDGKDWEEQFLHAEI